MACERYEEKLEWIELIINGLPVKREDAEDVYNWINSHTKGFKDLR